MNIAHIADFYNRYPGEVITYFTRLEVDGALTDLTVRIALPDGIVANDYVTRSNYGVIYPDLEVNEKGIFMAWRVGAAEVGKVYEYETQVRVAPTLQDMTLICEVVAIGTDARSELAVTRETAVVNVLAKGNYLKYLPALYDQDELMGRYLMLFESFWKPIETQIDHFHYYLDCQMTPLDFLPTLASWVSLELDERWSEDKRRLLVCAIVKIYRKRGTMWGLAKFLEIYTGVIPEIIEHRARNFAMGPLARLGQSMALGRNNLPHTFTVKMALPPLKAESESKRERLETERLRTIERIITLEKPAHTGYNLEISYEGRP